MYDDVSAYVVRTYVKTKTVPCLGEGCPCVSLPLLSDLYHKRQSATFGISCLSPPLKTCTIGDSQLDIIISQSPRVLPILLRVIAMEDSQPDLENFDTMRPTSMSVL